LKQYKEIIQHMSNAEKRLIWGSLFVRTVLVGLDIVGLGLLGISVSLASGSTFTKGTVTAKVIDLLSFIGGHNFYAIVAGVSVLFFLAKGAASLLLNFFIAAKLARFQAQRASKTLNKIIQSDLEPIENWSPVEIAHGLGGAMDDAFGRLITAVTNAYGEVVLIIGVSTFLIYTSPLLFMFLAIFFALVGAVLFLTTTKNTRRLSAEISRTTVASSTSVVETLSNYRQIFTLGVSSSITESFLETRLRMANSQEKLTTYSNMPRYIVEMAMMAGVGLLLVERTTPLSQSIPASVIAMFIGGALRVAASLLPLQGAYAMITHATSSAKISLELLKTFKTDKNSPTPASFLTSEDLSLEFASVSYRYPQSENFAISDVSFTLKNGDFLAVIGPSGAGKSTLADLAIGLRCPSAGEVLIGGVGAHDFVLGHPGEVAYVPQRTNLVSGTVAQNVALGSPGSKLNREKIWDALEKVQLKDLVSGLPNGIDTDLGKTGSSLSGGQIQRIGLARALYTQPKIMILDEATSALDDATEQAVQNAVNDLTGKTILIVIAHRLSTLKRANKILSIRNGSPEWLESLDGGVGIANLSEFDVTD